MDRFVTVIKPRGDSARVSVVGEKELDDIASKVPVGEYVVYILTSKPKCCRTYCGVTNYLKHRLRQHNGEIKGGARATSTDRPWILSGIVNGFGDDKSMAMRFEWFCKVKHYKGSITGTSGPDRRRFLINHALQKCQKDCIRAWICEERMKPNYYEHTTVTGSDRGLTVMKFS